MRNGLMRSIRVAGAFWSRQNAMVAHIINTRHQPNPSPPKRKRFRRNKRPAARAVFLPGPKALPKRLDSPPNAVQPADFDLLLRQKQCSQALRGFQKRPLRDS